MLTSWKMATLVAVICFSNNSFAEIIYQSGSLGETGISWQNVLNQTVLGKNVNPDVFAGARFEVVEPVLTTRIGGHFVGHPGTLDNEFFGTLIQLNSATDIPNSDDLSTADVLGVTKLTFPEISDEVFGDLSVTLSPGH